MKMDYEPTKLAKSSNHTKKGKKKGFFITKHHFSGSIIQE